MKPIRLILLLMIAAASVFAQSPQRFNYQAVARDASGNPLSEKTLGVQLSILDNSEAGTTLYSETFSSKTNKQGLFSVQVGGGGAILGSFSGILWGSSPKFLKVEIDAAGGSSYELLGTSQLLSVPYALSADRLSAPLAISELSDVSDVTPVPNQVLMWDGTNWTPGSGSSLITSTEFLGYGTSTDPLKLAPQGATNGQVMQWNGSIWAPATISGGVGDNWGTQKVVATSVLSGDGTAALPLSIAQQGATNGQILKWNGTSWAPGFDNGPDNWGTAKVNASAQFSGDGTPVNPLKLAANGAQVGQFMKFDGTNWVAGDGGGSLTLPTSGNVSDPGAALQIQNNNGTGIVGINASSNTANAYGVQGRILNSTGANIAGVFGRNGSTSGAGYGVYGLHDGPGAGVYGEGTVGVSAKSTAASSMAIYANATGTNSTGIVATGPSGVSGTATAANGKGVYGSANIASGYAGWFDGQTLLRYNSTASAPNLYIWEDDMNDKARILFNNGVVGESWIVSAFTPSSGGTSADKFAVTHFSGGDILTVTGDKKVGINVSNPSTELEVNGSITLNGGLRVNSTYGTAGQVLTTTGGSAQWTSATAGIFNTMVLKEQVNTTAIPTTQVALDGLTSSPMAFTTTAAARASFTFSHSQFVNSGAEVEFEVEIGFKDASNGNVINRTFCNDVIGAGKKKTFSYTHHCYFSGAGTYWPYILIRTTNGTTFNAVGGNSNGQVTIIVSQQ